MPLRVLLRACILKEVIYKLERGTSKHPNYHGRKDTIPLIVALRGEILLRASRVINEVINRCGIFMYSGLYLRSALHAMSNEFYPCMGRISRERAGGCTPIGKTHLSLFIVSFNFAFPYFFLFKVC